MEKEHSSVPPGIGPKLPEQAPAPKRRPVRRETALLAAAALLLVVLATWFIVYAMGSARTAEQTVNQQVADDTYKVQQEIAHLALPGAAQRSIYFYISSDALSCALLERGGGGYKLLTVGGHMALTAPGKDGAWAVASLDGNQQYLVFGLLYDKSLHGVEVDGQPAVVVDNGTYRCWYYYGEGLMSMSSESVIYR